MTVTEEIQLRLREIRMTQNSELVYSPVESSERPIAAKAMTPMAVAPKSGHMVLRDHFADDFELVPARPRCRP